MDSDRKESRQAILDPLSGQRDRRANPRLQCKGVAEFRVLPEGPKFTGYVLNLCMGGCLIECEKEVPETARGIVEVQLDVDDFRLRLAGRIRHIEDGTKAGIQFIEVSSRKEEQIRHLMTELVETEKLRQAAAKAAQQEAGEE